MNIPFTLEQFLNVFEQYNHAVWPMQVILDFLAVGVILLAIKPLRCSSKIITAVLSFFWLWMGIVYHFMYFTTINTAAYAFATLFVVQGGIFARAGVAKENLSFRFRMNAQGVVGGLLMLFALAIYPRIGEALGHVYPHSPTFGLPCPTTIFTFGLLLWSDGRVPRHVLIIPFIWSVIGFSAAFTLGIKEDVGLLVAGIVSTVIFLLQGRKSRLQTS